MVDPTIGQELVMVKYSVHDCLKGSWHIGEARGKHLELVVVDRSPRGSLGPGRLLQQYLMKARGSIQACEAL